MKHQRTALAVLLIPVVLATEWIWLRLRDLPFEAMAARLRGFLDGTV